MADYVIHVGPHKTGSTFLQTTLKAHAPFLRAHGVLYPDDQGDLGHLLLARKLARPDLHAELAAQFEAYAATGCRTVVLSAEDLAPMDAAAIATLRRLLGDQPARIVFYCRSWASVSLSNWGEQVRHGFATPLDVTLRQRIEHPRTSPPINYGIVLRRHAEAFGQDALALVSLDALATAGLGTPAHFAASFLGVELPSSSPAEGNPNTALPLEQAELIRALNALRLAREGKRDGVMRRLFLRMQPRLQITTVLREIATHRAVMVFDETAPKLRRLHDRLFEAFGARLVPPALPGRFFVPQRREIAYIDPAYLDLPAVGAELEAAYARLSAAHASGLASPRAQSNSASSGLT